MWRKIDGWWTRHSDGRRYDRGPMYLSVLVGLFLTAISMLLQGPTPTGPISAALDAASQTTLATSMLIGTGSMLFGSAAGARFFFPKWQRTRCYQVGIAGVPISVTGLVMYSWATITETPNFLSAMGGAMTPLMAIGLSVNGFYFTLEIRRIERNVNVIKREEGIGDA